jgi:HEAT repeat protein
MRERGKLVRHHPNSNHWTLARWGSRLAAGALLSLGLCGCASFWDEVTSKDFSVSTMFNPPNPLMVLKESTDGDQRAKALAALHEPKQNGGTDQDQDFVVQVLTTAASSERQPWCRLKAIGSLGQFKDPRAVKGLEDAYYKASVFPPDTAHNIRVASITALGNTKNPDAVPILVRLVRQKPVEGSEQEKRQNLDERIASAHALGNFSQYQATEALVAVVQSDKDIALRDCAYDSLKTITGKDFPPEPQVWAEFLHQNGNKDIVVEAQGPFGKIMGWFDAGN